MKSEISAAIKQICQEKNISYESVIETIEAALAVAYRKDFGEKDQNIIVNFDPDTSKSDVFDVKKVVADEAEDLESFDPKAEIILTEAQKIKKGAKIDDELKEKLVPPTDYGRMAAQTAKQVIIQKLREAERETLYNEYKSKEGEIVTGIIQGIEGRVVLVELGHATGIMPPQEQIRDENYRSGQRMKIFIVSVNATSKGPEIIVSRAHPDMVKRLFTQEVPEIQNGAIEIKAIGREAGSRTKIAVRSNQANIDPIGSCVGQRGSRVQTIIGELGGEKVDIVQYDDDPIKFIVNALSPAKIISVKLDRKEKSAIAEVKEDQLSLAIGKGGQNVRLSARISGWKIDIVPEGEKKPARADKDDKKDEDKEEKDKKEDESEKKTDKKEKKETKEDDEPKKKKKEKAEKEEEEKPNPKKEDKEEKDKKEEGKKGN
ncbi:MAG: transcription termination factor NusA [Patescibacteria group bacterium]